MSALTELSFSSQTQLKADDIDSNSAQASAASTAQSDIIQDVLNKVGKTDKSPNTNNKES